MTERAAQYSRQQSDPVQNQPPLKNKSKLGAKTNPVKSSVTPKPAKMQRNTANIKAREKKQPTDLNTSSSSAVAVNINKPVSGEADAKSLKKKRPIEIENDPITVKKTCIENEIDSSGGFDRYRFIFIIFCSTF